MEERTSLKDYLVDNYDRYFDLTDSRLARLNYMLDNLYCSYIDLDEFKSLFGLEDKGYLSILKFVCIQDNWYAIAAYGNAIAENFVQKVPSTLGV